MSDATELLQRAQERLERLRAKLDGLDTAASSGSDADFDRAVDDLAEIAEIAKEIEADVQRARLAADARP